MTPSSRHERAAQSAAVNAPLLERARRARPLLAVHRGTGLGAIPENTTGAVIAATRQGADIVEIDVVRSADGEYFVFHEGYERMHFALDRRLSELTSAEIRALRYEWFGHAPSGHGTVGVTSLIELLEACPEVFLNVDHSWRYWPELFDVFDRHADASRILLKCGPDDRLLSALAAHPVAYPLFLRVTEQEQIERAWAHPGLNVIGFELIAGAAQHPLADPALIARLRGDGYLVFLNALSFGPTSVQFAGWDDDTSVLGDPDQGWGRLIAAGADVVQTDWPDLFLRYRDERT